MSKKQNIINYVISFAATIGLLLLTVSVSNARYSANAFAAVSFFAIGAVVDGFIITLFHELGHKWFGGANGFKTLSLTVWFFRSYKRGKKTEFSFCLLGEEAGSTVAVPTYTENLAARYKRMTFGGLFFTFILTLAGVPAYFVKGVPLFVYALWAMLVPIGAYSFLGNALPAENGGARNDGAVLLGLKKLDDSTKVTLSLLAVQAELYGGKTPSEINPDYYFGVPQLPEDDLNFITLLNARYNYYLDGGDYENAKKVSDRLLTLTEYMPKSFVCVVKADALFNACTFAFDPNAADDLAYELEKYLNNVNDAATVRVKAAYAANVLGEPEGVERFYKKAVKEASLCPVKGLGDMEKKLIDKLKNGDFRPI